MREFATLAATAVVGLAATASAVTITPGNVGSLNDQNVQFNHAGLVLSGHTVEGAVSSPEAVFEFISGEVLGVQGIGQASIVPGVGETSFDDLLIRPKVMGVTFESLILNLDIPGTGQTTGTVDFTVTEADGGVFMQSFGLSGSGQNFFTIEAMANDPLASVSLTTSPGLVNVQQVRIGGVFVPEPTAAASLAIAGLVMLRRRH